MLLIPYIIQHVSRHKTKPLSKRCRVSIGNGHILLFCYNEKQQLSAWQGQKALGLAHTAASSIGANPRQTLTPLPWLQSCCLKPSPGCSTTPSPQGSCTDADQGQQPGAGAHPKPGETNHGASGCCLQPRLHYSPASRANKASAPRAGKLGKVYKSEALTSDCTEKSYKGCIQALVATKVQETVLTAAHPAQLVTLPISTGIKRSDSRKK